MTILEIVRGSEREFGAVSRILLTLDPSLTPTEVARRYLEIRASVLSGQLRRIGAKHTQLALFAAKNRKGKTVAEIMSAWNEHAPEEWHYTTTSNFSRDVTASTKRLLHPPYRHPPIAAIA